MKSVSNELKELNAAIAAIDAQRHALGDAVAELALKPLRARQLALLKMQDAPAAPAEQMLRMATVLFLDIAGSTAMSQRFDPEELHVIMDTALTRFTGVISKRGGRTLKYMGDGLMAVFGADGVREDDAQRGVLAGLDLLEASRQYAQEVQRDFGISKFDVRVGVHTGSVLMGGGVDADTNIRGMGVNVAARMEQSAPIGGLRISADTYALVRGHFEVIAQEPIAVKGVDAPVRTYLVVRALSRVLHHAVRGIDGVTTRMIGRDAELACIQDVFARLHPRGSLSLIVVAAEAGVGKSRLLKEFLDWAHTHGGAFTLLCGQAIPTTQSQPFGLIRDVLARQLQIADDDSVENARSTFERGVEPILATSYSLEQSQAHSHILGHLIGLAYQDSRFVKPILEDPRQIRNRGNHAAAEYLRCVIAASGVPMVLHLEDLHWADSESLDLVRHLCEANRNEPILIIASTRQSVFERNPFWHGAVDAYRRIDLAALNRVQSELLAQEMLQKLTVAVPTLLEMVTARAEGNPFYMEELVKMLIDQQAIRVDSDGWSVDETNLRDCTIPATLTGVLQARVDSLPANERLVLQEASVIGQVFWDQALQALDPGSMPALTRLVQRELTLPRTNGSAMGLREFAFKHAILHQVTYDMVLKRTRTELHGKLARWLAGLPGARANDFLGQTAGHFELAHDWTHAAYYHMLAAEYAGVRFAHERVLHHTTRALELLDQCQDPVTSVVDNMHVPLPLDAIRLRALKARELTLDMQGQRNQQRADLISIASLSERLQDHSLRAHAAWRQIYLELRVGNFARAQELGEHGIRLSKVMADSHLRLQCQRLLALALAFQGQWRQGQAVAQEALAQVDATGDLLLKYRIVNALGLIASSICSDPIAGLGLSLQGMEIAQRIGDPHEEAVALVNLGDCLMKLGELHNAKCHFEQAIQRLQGIGDTAMTCTALINLARIATLQSDHVEALSFADKACGMAVASGVRRSEVSALLRLGDAHMALGEREPAKTAYGRARELAQDMGLTRTFEPLAGLARLALQAGDVPTAMNHVEPILNAVDAGGAVDGVDFPREIEFTCYGVLRAGNDSRAAAWLQEIHQRLQSMALRIESDAMRANYLGQIPAHRHIVEAFESSVASQRY